MALGSTEVTSIKTLVSNYILKKGDICCEKDYNRDKIINQIFKVYEDMFMSDYLEYIDNDIMLFIGYYIDLQNNNDTEGMKLWKYIYAQIPPTDNKIQDENNIKTLLKSLPLFYLLSFLGLAHYKQQDFNKNFDQK